MKKKFTFLTAAFMLLAFLAVPLGMRGQTTYEQLTSIANIDESAQYVLGIDGTGFHYSGTSSWGLTALPSAQTPIYYTLTKANDGNSFTAQATISGTNYYLQVPTSNTFSMATSAGTNTDLIIGTTQVSETNYAVANKTTTTRHLRLNGANGLRSYATTTGTMAYFYKVVAPSGNTYTVTYHSNVTGNDNTVNVVYNEGDNVTVAANSFSNPGYAFTKWSTVAEGTGGTNYNPGDVIEDIDEDIDLYARWVESNDITATLTATNLELTTSYDDSDDTEITIDGITYIHTDLMKSSNNIQARASTGTIKNTTPYPGDITSVAITHSGTARATTINGSADGTNWTQVATGNGSITADFSGHGYKYFQITRGSNAAYWTKIEITYSTGGGSSQTQSDLAITNASTNLTFDLYNNSSAQVINYTTSSTGAISITPATPTDYFSYVHDATAKTITVTPLAVTPSAQTVTIGQAADDDYYAGQVSFTVSVANSTPLANIAALTAQTTDGSYTVSLTDALVTYVNGTNAYLEDAYGAVLLYHCADGLAVGDKITGTADVTYTIFNNLPEVTAYTLSTGHTLTHNNTVTPTEITISALESNFTNYISRYVKIVDATVTSAFSNRNCTIEQSGSSIVLRDQNNPGTLTTTVNDVVTVTAHPSIFSSTHQIAVYEQSQIVVTPSTTPSITLNTYTVDVDAAAHEEYLTITVGNIIGYDDSSFEVYFYESDGVTSADYSSWFDATVIDNPSGDGYVVYCAIQSNDAAERNAYMKVYILGNDFNEATSNLITITQAAPVLDYATLPFNWAGGTKSELNTQNGVTVTAADDDYAEQNAPYRVKFNNNGYNIVIKTNEQPAAVSVGIKKFGSGNASTLVIEGSVDGISYFEVETFAITGAQNNTFTYYTTNAFNANYRYVRIYFNKPSSGGANIGVGPITIRGIETYNKSITGYGNSAGGYVLLASPIKGANPVEVGMITDQLGATANSGNSTYDLYWFDQTAGAAQAWRNYRQETFNLAACKGYLYASKNGVDLTFTGTPNLNGTVALVKNNVAGDLEGWNLVGNPFGENAYIDRNFYAMNSEGTDVIQTSGAIAPMQGVFVVAASDGESLTFSTTAPSSSNNNNGIAMNLSQTLSTRGDSHENVIDRATVRFGEGDNLPKFQINPSNTKLYIPQNGKDYAVVRSEAHGEMPVNFKAAETGTYTINVETENLDVNYLHLIDNMTGLDVDLLATPSYTFEGKKSDYASRFKLVFSANDGNNEVDEDFAFISDGNIIILNEGEATLQVIDIMGRVISTQTVNGNASVNNVGTAGVYVLQLINGNNVKTQKIVVR